MERNINDHSLYVVDQVSRKYDTDENIVLKELLSIITDIIDNELQTFLNQGNKWIGIWDSDLYEKFKEVNRKNIYLRSFATRSTRGELAKICKDAIDFLKAEGKFDGFLSIDKR